MCIFVKNSELMSNYFFVYHCKSHAIPSHTMLKVEFPMYLSQVYMKYDVSFSVDHVITENRTK